LHHSRNTPDIKKACFISGRKLIRVGEVVVYNGKSVEVLSIKRNRDSRNGCLLTIEDNGKKKVHSSECSAL